MIVRQFAPPDLYLIALQPNQRALTEEVASPRYASELAANGDSFTVSSGGDVVAVIGLIHQWEGCERAYAFFSGDAGAHMAGIIFRVRSYLRTHPMRRVEAAVQSTFAQGHRLVRLLGFTHEGTMKKYWNDEDADLYARVR